jgi:hypothetical protein
LCPLPAISFGLVSAMFSAKDPGAIGHSSHTVLRVPVFIALVVALLVALCLFAARRADAAPCPPAVALTGEPALVSAVRAQLAARGIAPEAPACPVVRAHVERRGAWLVVGIDGPDGVPVERAVTEAATAATVIESWTREDVAAPLLETHAAPAGELAVVAPAPAIPAGPHGIQLFAAEETSLASDGTVWEGMQLGACVMLGPICAAARLHAGSVVSRPARWDGFARKGGELYAGIDVPIAVGRNRLSLGFGAGYGTTFTRHHEDSERMGLEMSGLRAETHAGFSVPVTAHVAIDVMVAGSLTQATHVETETRDAAPAVPTAQYPDEPRGFGRFSVGVRYGAL